MPKAGMKRQDSKGQGGAENRKQNSAKSDAPPLPVVHEKSKSGKGQ